MLFRLIPRLDSYLVVGTLLLCALSMLVLYSASGGSEQVMLRHGGRIIFGLALMFMFSRISPVMLSHLTPYIYILGLLLLAVVWAFGVEGNGAQRWLALGWIRFQPSEIMKIAVPMMVAWIMTNAPLPPSFASVVKGLLVTLLPAALIVLQPDLGTAIITLVAGLAALFLGGIRWRFILTAAVFMGVVVAPLFWYLVLHDYQRSRILTLLNPQADPLGHGYHAIQSIIAVGSGGIFGKGWLAGTQSRLDFIPEGSTDFIFAIFAEEFGFIGALLLLLLYLLVIWRGLYIAFYAKDSYSRLVGGCFSLLIFLSVFVNMGMVVGILPVVGIPLPLMSYGGSSYASLMIMLGMLSSMQYYSSPKR